MAKTQPKTKKQETRSTTAKENTGSKATTTTTTVVAVAKPTVAKGNGSHDNIYQDAVKEIVALNENDTYAKKIDNGPLSEARGKDTWRLHAQLRAVDQMDKNLSTHVSHLQSSLHDIDTHLHDDTVAVTSLVSTTRADVQKWITSTHAEVGDWVTGARDTVQEAVADTRTALAKQLTTSTNNITGEVSSLTETVKENFEKLAQATAGTEENLRSQTDAFSKAVENLLGSLQHDFDLKIAEFRDESTRLIDKRFNQADVAFAAVRADQEVIKALLTDIIKDRLGRAEPRNR